MISCARSCFVSRVIKLEIELDRIAAFSRIRELEQSDYASTAAGVIKTNDDFIELTVANVCELWRKATARGYMNEDARKFFLAIYTKLLSWHELKHDSPILSEGQYNKLKFWIGAPVYRARAYKQTKRKV